MEENFPAEQSRCAALPNEKSPTGEVGPFFGDCGEALHSDGAAFEQTVGTTFGNGIAEQRVGFGGCGYGIAEQWVGLSSRRNSALFQQTISTAFGDQRLGRGSSKSIQCEERESDAEKGLAFHECVLRGVVVRSGADLTPRA